MSKKTAQAGAQNVAKFPHNQNDSEEERDVENISGKRLKSFIERVERLEEEKSALGEDIKEVYAEAKGTGFEVKIMRRIVKLRKMDPDKRQEEDMLLELYQSAIGME